MYKIVTVVGARPQFVKASAISRVFNQYYSKCIEEVLLHTGQHYDENMSAVFFEEMEIPEPKYNLEVGSGKHGKQTGEMLSGIESVLYKENPDAVLVYGDTNSTLAGAIAAAKMHIPVIHVEAGLRSFNKNMPEEINRIVADHVSTLMFAPTQKAIENLKKEGFDVHINDKNYTADSPGIFLCGDIMYDNALFFSDVAERQSKIITNLRLERQKYILVTLHRENNTDDAGRLASIMRAVEKISSVSGIEAVIPFHPRTRKRWNDMQDNTLKNIIENNKRIIIIPALSYLDFLSLEKNALMVLTDSGGVQKESYFFKKNCIILREETEWVELVEMGTARLCGADETKIFEAFEYFRNHPAKEFPPIYGDGKSAMYIAEHIFRFLQKKKTAR